MRVLKRLKAVQTLLLTDYTKINGYPYYVMVRE